ncbi:DNA polymerase III subunit alpha [Yunchengibacter salinarum]|uniref:DNA polymerase III subunit alpha n=1 Tax=Yunchengibacter salinarum TaxID=3133399 RepID=UPI0035B66353
MTAATFIHLRVHTAYSLSEGAIHVADLVKQCVGLKMPAVAMTDTDNMFAALEFSSKAAESGVQPIVGVTLHVQNPFLTVDPRARSGPAPDQLVLLAQSETGYGNLMKLVSKGHLESDPTQGVRLPLEAFDGLTEGIICLSGGASGPVGRLLLEGDGAGAESCAARLQALFPDRFYMEISRHGLEAEDRTEEAMLDIAFDRGIPVVATNQPFFVSRDMYEAHDTLLCMADSTYVSAEDRRRLNPEFRFKTAEEMVELFKDIPEAIENTVNIAKRCHYRVKVIDPLLPNYTRGMDMSEADMLREWTLKGLAERLDFKAGEEGLTRGEDWEKPYHDRLEHELKIINQMGFPGYFLIVADFIQWAKDHDIPVGPGRGSGAGSLVAYALKITDLDPLRFSLLFERFLNPERVNMPDFDIDFCQDKRDRVIRYVQDKYGHDHVAQIITFGKLQARAVVKGCGRVMQQPYPVTDRLSKLIPNDPGNAMTLEQAIDYEPRLRQEMDSDELTAAVMDRALKLEGLYAHASTHAAGVVIGDRPLDQLVPLYQDPKSDMPVTQFNMKWVEQAGLVKFDFLGLKTLTVLDRAVGYIRQRGIEVDLDHVPLDNPAAFDLLQRGDTAGVFQLESAGMRSTLKGLKPDTFEDIIAIVALYRPGPMDNIPTYVNRKHGREEIEYPHPLLEGILSETNGVIIYQEQVMEIAQVMSGYSLGEADLLRRAMGKKIAEEMDKQRDRFCRGAEERGIAAKEANQVFDLVAKFALYGFNKSHAAAYALVAYHTAYLKANYPVEFMAAIMSLDLNNTDKLGEFKQELVRSEIPLLLPDINRSASAFTVETVDEPYCEPDDPRHDQGVRYALSAIKGVGEKAMDAVVAEREENGPFTDLFDFAERIDPRLMNKRQLEQLAAAGAFDQLVGDRAQAYASADLILKTAQRKAEERESNQVSLFGGEMGAQADRPALPMVKSWTDSDLLENERKAVGFYISAHPLDSYETILKRERILPARTVKRDSSLIGQTVRMAGAIIAWREGQSKKTGKRFGILALSDHTDSFEVMVFSDMLDAARALVDEGAPVVANVQLRQRDGEDVGLSARALDSLETVASNSAKKLLVDVTDPKAFEGIRAALDRRGGGRGRVMVRLALQGGQKLAEFELDGHFRVTPELRQAIAAEIGVMAVEEV